MKSPSNTLCVILWIVSVSICNSLEQGNPGIGTQGHLDTLYNLRNKLGSFSTASSVNPSLAIPARKESRGYSFHYAPSGVTNPVYSASFSSRAGKVDDNDSSTNINKGKSLSSKSWNKYSKLAYKTFPVGSQVNSFNVHQKLGKTESVAEVQKNTTRLPSTTTTTTTTTTAATPTFDLNSVGSLQSLSQGLNNVMTTVVTQRLMNLLDQDVPEGIFTPLKHIVATGNRMVEFWDKRANARDGKKPGIVEMLGYGLSQLKKFRDGQAVKSSDPVANLTSASRTLIQGMITVKKLTNRVLGYDITDELVESRGGGYGHDSYGHGGGGHMSYGRLDAYSVLATLGFGVFLFNVIFNLLNNNNMATGRSLDVSDFDVPLALSDVVGSANFKDVSPYKGSNFLGDSPYSLLAALAFGAFLLQLLLTLLNTSARSLNVVDLNTPLALSDFHLPNFKTTADNFFGTPTVRNKRDAGNIGGEDDLFNSVVNKLDGMYKTYKQISDQPSCARLHMCQLTLDEAYGDGNSMLSPLFVYGLGHWTKDKSSLEFVESIKTKVSNGEEVDCNKIAKDCVQKESRNFV